MSDLKLIFKTSVNFMSCLCGGHSLNGKILGGLFEHERLKPVTIRTGQGYVSNLPQ